MDKPQVKPDPIGYVDEAGVVRQAPRRKPWLNFKEDKEYQAFWRGTECYPKVYVEHRPGEQL